MLDLRNDRTPEQKKQTQAAAQQDARQANTLEKKRLSQEKAAQEIIIGSSLTQQH